MVIRKTSATDEIIQTLREQVKLKEKLFKGARRVAFADMIDGLGLGSYSYLGDDYGPTPVDIEALGEMFALLYINASRYKPVEWAQKKFAKYCEPSRVILKERGLKEEEINQRMPLFEDWFIDTCRRAWVWLIKWKLSDILARSQTSFERQQQKEETAAGMAALHIPMFDRRGGVPSTLTGPVSIEDELKKQAQDEEKENE